MVTGSIYFLGHYKPAHFAGETPAAVRRAMLAALATVEPDTRLWFEMRVHEIARDMRRYAAVSREHGARGVSMAKRPHDPWLDDVTAALPAFPGLDYSGAVNA